MTQHIKCTRDSDGYWVVLYPNLNCGLTIEEIAEKDMPEGFDRWELVEAGTEAARFHPIDAARKERGNRALLLEEVDAIANSPLRWAGLTEEQQTEVATYRQELLDITDQAGFPYDIMWPTKPDFL